MKSVFIKASDLKGEYMGALLGTNDKTPTNVPETAPTQSSALGGTGVHKAEVTVEEFLALTGVLTNAE